MRLGAVAACALAMMLIASPFVVFGQSAEELSVQEIDASAYPKVSVRVSVPPSLAGAEDVQFKVAENGSAIDDVVAEHVKGDTVPASVVLVIDASGSMEGAPLADAKQAARAFVDALGEDAQVALVSFSDRPVIVSGFNDDPRALLPQIDGLQAAGETALYDAVVAAAGLVPRNTDGQRAIVVLSDGGDTVSAQTFEAATAAVADAGAPVFAVALQSEEYNPAALETLAASSGGRLTPVAKSSELAASFEAIAREIRDAYVVTWTSTRPRTKDIEVDVVASAGGSEVGAALVYDNPAFQWAATEGADDLVTPQTREDVGVLLAAVALAFGSVSLLAIGALTLLARERTGLSDLHYYDQLRARTDGAAGGGVVDQVRARVVDAVGSVAGKRGITQMVGLKLEQAGLQLRPAEYITFHSLGVIIAGALTQLLVGNFVLSFAVVVALSFGPVLMLDIAIDRRRARFEAQLPDVLGMIASSLRGGWGLLQAVEFVVGQAAEPAAGEFRRVQTEARLGMPLEESLILMSRRLGSQDLDAAVTAIIIQREVGGNLAEVLDIVAQTVRDRAALKRQVSALTAEGRLSAYILIALPILEAVVLSFVSPGYLVPMYTNPLGIAMALGSIGLIVIGSIWLRAVTKVEV